MPFGFKASNIQTKQEPKVRQNKTTNIRDIVDYNRPFSFFYSGVESKQYLDLLIEEGITNFLISFEHAREMGDDHYDYCRAKGVKFFVDSGAFTYMTGKYEDKTEYYWEELIKTYLFWVERNSDLVFAVANMDIEVLVGAEKVREWNVKYFEPFMLRTGIPVCFVWHEQSGGEEAWIRYCKRYPYVGITAMADENLDMQDFIARKIKIAQKYNTVVHGMGIAQTKVLHKLPLYSADSTTWKSGVEYGHYTIFNGHYTEQVYDRNFERDVLPCILNYKRKFNIDKLIMKDEDEMLRSSLYAFVQAERYLRFMLKPLSYWMRSRPVKNDVHNESLYPSVEWLKGDEDYPDYKDYARQLNIYPDDDKNITVDHIFYATVFANWDNEKYKSARDMITRGEIQELHYMYFDDIRETDDERTQDLIDFYVACVTGQDDTLLIKGSVYDRISRERDNYVEDDPFLLVPASNDEIRDRLIEANVENAINREISDLDISTIQSIGLVPIEQGNKTVVKKAVRKAKNINTSKMPAQACSFCTNALSCPYYKEGSICAYNKLVKQFDVRDPMDLMDAASSIANVSLERLQRGYISEILNGRLDGQVTGLIDQSMRLLRNLSEVGSTVETLRRTQTVSSDGSTVETLQYNNPREGGILSSLIKKSLVKQDAQEEMVVELKPVVPFDSTSDSTMYGIDN